MREQRIGEVGGEMGFASVRESFALVDRVHAELKVGGGEVEWIGYSGAARQSVGDLGPTFACRSCVSLSLVRGVELKGDGFRTLMPFLLN
nr:hypothetical protein CFP56_23219 [Quercus suber]